jgi:DNA-binding CsgD family transcriptional regulator
MNKSVLVRLDEVRAVFDLVAECCEQGHDPTLWQTHMAAGLARLFHATWVQGGEFRTEGPRAYPVCAASAGPLNDEAVALYARIQSHPELPTNPIIETAFSRQKQNATSDTADLIDPREWYRDPYNCELMLPAGFDDTLVTRRLGPDRSDHLVLVIRGVGDERFGLREKAMLALFHDTLAPHLGRELATANDPVARLTPRLRDVLRCLLEGDTEKQAARRLGVTPATVHDHVKALYRHFGVGSRPQLTAYFLRRGWKLPF